MRHIPVVVLILLACFVSAAFSQESASNPLNNWSEFLRTNMQRYNPYEDTLNVSNVPNLQMKWAYLMGTDTISSPVVAGGVVYLQATYSDFASVLAVKDDSLLWVFNEGIDTGPGSTPAVANGVVYFSGGQGGMFAVDATTGALLWNNYGVFAYGNSSPAVVGNVMYVGGGFNGTGLAALDAGTGDSVWVLPYAGGVNSSPAVVDNVVYAGTGEGKVLALDPTTGAELWSYGTRGAVESSAAVADGVVYIGSNDNNLYALNATTGAKLWSYSTGGEVQSSPAVANGVVYVGSNDKNLYALNATTGAKLWSYTTSGGVSSSPAVANGVVYVGAPATTVSCCGTYGNNLYALNAANGALLWTYVPDTPSASTSGYSPAVANGQVYFGSTYGHSVVAFGLE